jgi:hypothetical protein
MSLPPIVAKITADTSELSKGLGDATTRLRTFAKVGGAAVGAVGVAMVALTKASLSNIDANTKQARSLGLTHDALKRMALVANEAGVETGQLTSMLGLMQRNIDALAEGTKAQVEAFKRLGLSISDLQGLSPDEQFARIAEALDKISDPTQKTALAMDVFGRSGRNAINMLDSYRAKTQEAATFQERFGIAVRQSTAESIERANDAVGRLGMVMEGLGNRLAGLVAPAIEATANGLINFAATVLGIRVELEQFFGTLEMARASLGEDLFLKIMGRPDLIRDHAPSIAAVVNEMDQLQTIAVALAPQLKTFADELKGIDADATRLARIELEGLADSIKQADEDLKNGIITQEQYNFELQHTIERAWEIVKANEAINNSNFSNAFANIATLAKRYLEAAKAAAQARANIQAALFEQSPAGQAMGSYAGRGTTSDRSIIVPEGPAPQVGGGVARSGGGGGSLRDALAERLETLIEGLQTEAEVINAWYEAGQQTLEDALARKLLTEDEYRQQRERLEEEHQRRMGEIRKAGEEFGIQTVLGAGEEILQAIGQTNEQALRIAKIFGAAQALISAYQGAAEALKLPFPKNLAAAATVLAKGISFVNAIRGAGKGGATSAGSAATGASAPQQNVQTLNFTLVNDSFGIGQNIVRQIASQLNEAQRNGNTLIRATVS